MKVELRKIDTIRPYPGNPRRNDGAVEVVAASLRQFGCRQPVVVDVDGVIICGHTRFRAAQSLGWDKVPVHVAKDLSPEQVKAYRIADNKTAEHAEWDFDLLPIELGSLQDAGYDLGGLGFDEDELARLLAPIAAEGLTDPDDVPEPPKVAVTKPGDLWLLGEHRLLCGDSTRAEDVSRLTGDEPCDLLLTDPPYNVAYTGKTADALTIDNDAMDEGAYRTFLVEALQASTARLKPGGAFYLWHADSHGRVVREASAAAQLAVRQCLVWVKSTFALGRQDYHWQHEPCLYGWKAGAAHTWLADRKQSTVLRFDKPSRNGLHPTMKPVELFAYLVANSCPTGGRVLDPFGGSGSTLIAAQQLNRRALLMELDPVYVDVIVQRFEAYTGTKAERLAA